MISLSLYNLIVLSLRLWDNTFTVFSTDNGGEPVYGGYNWPLRGTKHTLWEGGVRGAALVHGKMLEKTGVKCEGLLHITDFFPTLINLAGNFKLVIVLTKSVPAFLHMIWAYFQQTLSTVKLIF